MDNYGKLVCGKIVFNVLFYVSKFSDRVKLINDKSVTYWQEEMQNLWMQETEIETSI